MNILHIENENYDDLVKEGIVLVDFYAEWCGPCKMLGPVLGALSSQNSNVKIIKVDVDQQRDIVEKFGIMSVPTLLLYKDGQIVYKQMGYQTLDTLNQWIDSVK